MSRMILTKLYEFSAAHWLPLVPDGHKCKNMHGHNWIVHVSVRGVVQEDGFVCDYADIDYCVKPIINDLDHHCLNDRIQNPTSENLCLYFWKRLQRLAGLYEVSISESSKTLCSYRGES
jgi:6-pyruvoyltetrahydropterin/6-carboxytetrahydropterin synthase